MTTTMPPGTLLATGAHDAGYPAAPCAICERDMLPGERIARLLPDFCPGGCGGLTEDPYGGPCRACWDKVPGPYPGDERCDWCQKFLSGDGFCDDGRIFCGEDCAGAYAAEWGVGLRSLALTEPCSPGPEHRLSNVGFPGARLT